MMLNEDAVRRFLTMSDCIDAMQQAFAAAAAGDFVQPLRIIAWQPDRRGAVAGMPAYLRGFLGAKLITIFPENRKEGLESHQGLVALHESRTGSLLAIAHAGAITAIRTAAVSALATKMLANEDASDLALIGSGVQAEEHLRSISCVRKLRRVRVWSRTRENARDFAARSEGSQVPVSACEDVRQAVRGADIICTVTAAMEPVLEGDWVSPGAHVNAVGSSVPPFRELDTALVARSRVYVDMRETTLRESEDLLEPIRRGAITREHILGELPEMVSGKCTLRTAPDQITLFKSVGMAIEDLAAARVVYERASKSDSVTYFDF